MENKPDFEKFYDTFIEDYAFQVPYNGSNNFYDEGKLKDLHLRKATEKAWTSHVLPLQKEIEEKDKAIERLKALVEKAFQAGDDYCYYANFGKVPNPHPHKEKWLSENLALLQKNETGIKE